MLSAVNLVVNVDSRGIFRVSSAKSRLPDSSDTFLFGMNIILQFLQWLASYTSCMDNLDS